MDDVIHNLDANFDKDGKITEKALINMALKAKEKGIEPIPFYFIDTKDGNYLVKVSERPSRVFYSNGKPFYFDNVIRLPKKGEK